MPPTEPFYPNALSASRNQSRAVYRDSCGPLALWDNEFVNAVPALFLRLKET